MSRLTCLCLTLLLGTSLLLGGIPSQRSSASAMPVCRPGSKVVLKGAMGIDKENSYELLPFKVASGVSKLKVTYSYTGDETVLDLGVWDNDGAFTYAGFRGWSGSRQGRTDDGDGDGKPDQPPIVIRADKASRNYLPAPIGPGRWTVELGGGSIPEEAQYRVTVSCREVSVGRPPASDPVDASHVANPDPGWYFGDFHMHAYHSNLSAPNEAEFVEFARAAKLDFMPITEYQINRHWREWGDTARANPDLIFWPGREVITYFGHAGVIGETPGMVEYRHGFKNISMADIQAESVADGAVFQINHPTTFPAPLDDLCRGCAWELDDAVDMTKVDTIEIVNVGVQRPSDGFPNPFVQSAIDYWVEKLLAGFHIAPVGGSDDKIGPNYGTPATAVYGEDLSRDALREGIRDGHVWIAARGVSASPHLRFEAAAEGQMGIFGDTLAADAATFTATVTGGSGHTLWIYRNGDAVQSIPIASDDFTYEFAGTASDTANPLGTFYRIETRETVQGEPAPPGLLSSLGMPIFLKQ